MSESTVEPVDLGGPSWSATTMGEGPVIEVDHVTKWFGDVVAVSDVSFTVGTGVTALLGPNGAGKSTLLRLMGGLTRPSQGTLRVLGSTPRSDLAVMGRIGLVPQQETLFDRLTARQMVTVAATLSALDAPDERAVAALRLVELDADDARRLRSYSKGMRQRVKVATGLVHEPDLLLLDEPLAGLDPRQRLALIDIFHELADGGRCVLVSSHVLDEVERFGSQVIVIAQGRLAAQGDFRAIRDLMDDRPRRLRVRCSAPRALASALLDRADTGVVAVELVSDDELRVDTDNITVFRTELVQIAVRLDVDLQELTALDEDLDSVFRYLVEP